MKTMNKKLMTPWSHLIRSAGQHWDTCFPSVQHRYCTAHQNIRKICCLPRSRHLHLILLNCTRWSSVSESTFLSSHNGVIFVKKFLSESSSIDNDSDGESDSEMTPNRYFRQYIYSDESELVTLNDLLYGDSKDPIILELNRAASVQQVFDVIKGNSDILNECHTSQAVIILWTLQKISQKVHVEHDLDSEYKFVRDYVMQVRNHEDFKLLLKKVEETCPNMSHDALACTLLYLTKLGISVKQPVIQKLVSCCESEIESMPLTALSRFAVAIQDNGLWSLMVLQKTLPTLLKWLDKCSHAEELRLLTICLLNIQTFVTKSILDMYIKKVENLVERNILTGVDAKTVVKVASFLNAPYWSSETALATRMVVLILQGHVQSLRSIDLVVLHKICIGLLEPSAVLCEIQEHAAKLLQEEEELLPRVDLLSCVASFSSFSQRKTFEQLTSTYIKNADLCFSMPLLFKTLRHLKTSDVHLCNIFWNKTLQNLMSNDDARERYNLLKFCHKYMHFNNNLGGTYRHYSFENQMIEWLMEKLKGVDGMVPSRFARIFSFIVAYSKHDIPSELLTALENLSPQFSIIDCVGISRGVAIAVSLRQRKAGQSFLDQITVINHVLNECTLRHLKDIHSIRELNMLMRSYAGRKGVPNTMLHNTLIEGYATNKDPLSSRYIRDVSLNLVNTNTLVPQIVNRIGEYIVANSDHVIGDTAAKVIFMCYYFGYSPPVTGFLSAVSNIIDRDKEKLAGLPLLQSALSLGLFQHLPESLIHYIFTITFLEQLDDEIASCYSKASYPHKVRHTLMELNRTVCLDFPEVDIPWFHKKYCEEIASKDSTTMTPFQLDVLNGIVSVLGGRDFVQTNGYSPYFYNIDFLIVLDENQQPIRTNDLRHRDITVKDTRVAVLLRPDDAFCVNVPELKGSHQLKQRHLEIMGYRVVGISRHLWNSMFMAEPEAKFNYLREHILDLREARADSRRL